jgi:hypothetical protein
VSISTVGELKTAVANWLARGDLTARIPEFMALLDADLRRNLRKRNTRAPFTLSTNPQTLGAIGDLRAIRYNTSTLQCPLTIVSYAALADLRRSGSGMPAYAAVLGTSGGDPELHVDVTPDTPYVMEIVYYEVYTLLSSLSDASNPTILLNNPDLYLYGTLLQSAPYLEHDDRIAVWQGLYQKALDDENVLRERIEFTAAPLQMALPVVF